MAETISPHDLVPMDLFHSEPMRIDIVYANRTHPENIFGINLYRHDARMILHRDLARVVIVTARTLRRDYGWTLVLKDGLRTVNAQEKLMLTNTVLQNPHWLEEPNRLLSSPGKGAHPRGMAIDVSIDGVDMGTVFDEMTEQSARAYTGFDAVILDNRQKLEDAFMNAAKKLHLPLLPLPSEWWDFRFPASHHEQWDPLRDEDLPASLRMTMDGSTDDNSMMHFDKVVKEVLNSL